MRSSLHRVIEVLSFDKNIADAEEALFELGVMKAAGQFLELDREIRILHLAGKRIFETSLESRRTVDIQLGSGQESRGEERETLNVIPVRMPDQQMNAMRAGTSQHVQTKNPNACAGIQDERCSIRGCQLHTRGVAAVNRRSVSRCRDRPSRTPKANTHD